MPDQLVVIPPRVPLIDPRSGLISREWYQYLNRQTVVVNDHTTTVAGSPLTKVDDTNVTLTLGGTPSTALLTAATLTLGWTGQLALSRGGTGASTAANARTNLGLAIGTDVQAHSEHLDTASSLGSAGQVLRVNVAGDGLEYGTTVYVHEELAGSSSWVIAHNLGKKPSVTVVDSGGSLLWGEIVYTDDNNLTVTFSAPVNGKAYLN